MQALEWTHEHAAEASVLGFELREIWDERHARLEFEIFKGDAGRFPNDEAARAYVIDNAKRGSGVYLHALSIAFRSKLNPPTKAKPKKWKSS